MSIYRLNLIDGVQAQAETEVYQIREKKGGRFLFYFSIVVLIGVIMFFFNSVSGSNEIFFSLSRLPIIREVGQLLNLYDNSLEGEKEDRINILILGIGGEGHQGPYLTDTIILASFKPSTKKVALLSVPRDLYVPIPEFGWHKINSAYALGLTHRGDGSRLTSEVVSNVFEEPINYYARIDFNLFKEIVDALGGIEINVEREFSDYQFPGPNFTYQVVSFKAGPQVMDGEKALQYVRSRHGTNNEASDFARSARQQRIILAIKDKIIKNELLKKPKGIFELYNLFNKDVETNLKVGEIIKLAKIFSEVDKDKIITKVITSDGNGPLKSEIGLDGAYLLKTKTGNFEDLAQIAHLIFEGN
ncbi:hypothetical protein COW09_01275 [bacterium (Candidatus Moisslbacteria) CG12_big_fil_rev_8_21_14_0_65_36_11]|nr:LCP family protein [Candidatus Kuenenbacteria bacterium]OIP76488.1 MAG: hypothetical protein AUK09_01815 [Parcubacteria group bacterium CG2_30_36_38]PIV45969.1 MAG: hypothetical protein COS23_01735 [bacterium (Candidatus Moisslbacteria) CG02_land_8_20_14_3_00_36_53]PIW67872.1 MAG: hypothetical protein COW09_01275 [bacterium (Candidatus Moisslbacteria) CG12_big_fil_rev_8_21_14_0_65_36_11]PJC00557.1 MAG: hypothetical protein CO074_01905 [bacterium (Candidatus Moisslbacteria) CG_4_9_14_0_8_um_f